MKNTMEFSYDGYLGAVNGLICFTFPFKHSVCIYNISTREVTPWIESTLPVEVKQKYGKFLMILVVVPMDLGLILSPRITKWYVSEWYWRSFNRKPDDSEFWEVLTLGHNAWRTIIDAPPFTLGFSAISPVYVNGSIYWSSCKSNGFADFIVAFDVGCEKFRMIQIPDFILHQAFDLDGYLGPSICVLEVDGRVALLQKISTEAVKVWIYEDDAKEMIKATTIDSGEKRWIGKSITLPVSWEWRGFFFLTVGGTDQMILEIQDLENEQIFTESLYSYDWKNNTFKEIIISGINNSIHEEYDRIILFTAFSESLVSFSPTEKRRYI